MSQPALVVFDLDGTLIDADCAQDWLTFLKNKGWPGAADAEAKCARIMESYTSGQMDMQAYMDCWTAPIAGYPVSEIDALAEEFAESLMAPAIFPQGQACVNAHLTAGDQVLLISASPLLVVAPIARLLGIEHAIGIEIVSEHGIVQRETTQPFSFRDGKVACLHNWLAGQDLQNLSLTMAYSDSVNDRALLESAITAVVVNGDSALLKLASQRGWRSLSWDLSHRGSAAKGM